MNKLFFVLLLGFLVACAPIPHAAKVVPEISGTVFFEGVPAVGAEVRLCKDFQNGKCRKYISVHSDENGNFKLKPRRQFRWYVTLLGDEMFGYGFSVSYNGTTYPGCSGTDLGVLEDVPHINYELTSKKKCYLNLGG